MSGNRRRPRDGFVLVLVLVLIVLAALILAGTARHSLRLALEAAEAQEDLQLRWGLYSCQQAFAARGAVVFAQLRAPDPETGESPDATNSLQASLELGELRIELRLADENAKLNLNTFYHEGDRQAVSQLVREQSQGGLPVVLRPFRVAANDRSFPVFDSWGQVFALDRVDPLNVEDPPQVRLASATTQLTCWGDGRLNVRWASEEGVESICRLAGEERAASRLLALRSQVPSLTLRELLDSLSLRERKRRHLELLFTDRSTCFSLWMAASNGRRHWHELHIAASDARGMIRTTGFTW